MSGSGVEPIVLTSSVIRRQFKKITEQVMPGLAVLSDKELNKDVEIFSEATVSI